MTRDAEASCFVRSRDGVEKMFHRLEGIDETVSTNGRLVREEVQRLRDEVRVAQGERVERDS